MPSPALPPHNSSIPLPPAIYLHLPTPGLLPPLLHRFGCHVRELNPLPPGKKKKAAVFPLVHYASEMLGSTNTGEAPENMILQTLLEAETGKH